MMAEVNPMPGSRNVGGCLCRDCGNDSGASRAQEKREWRQESVAEMDEDDDHFPFSDPFRAAIHAIAVRAVAPKERREAP